MDDITNVTSHETETNFGIVESSMAAWSPHEPQMSVSPFSREPGGIDEYDGSMRPTQPSHETPQPSSGPRTDIPRPTQPSHERPQPWIETANPSQGPSRESIRQLVEDAMRGLAQPGPAGGDIHSDSVRPTQSAQHNNLRRPDHPSHETPQTLREILNPSQGPSIDSIRQSVGEALQRQAQTRPAMGGETNNDSVKPTQSAPHNLLRKPESPSHTPQELNRLRQILNPSSTQPAPSMTDIRFPSFDLSERSNHDHA